MHSDSGIDAAELLDHYSLWDPEHEKVKWELFEHARNNCPVAHTDASGGGQYLVTRYEDVRRVLQDPATFSSAKVVPGGAPVTLNPLDSDPPLQPELRKILNPLFTRNFLRQFEPDLRRSANHLIDGFIDNGRVDFIKEFAGPFVGSALATVVFNESDPEQMKRASDIVIRAGEAEDQTVLFELVALGKDYLDDRERHPVDRHDVLNAITTGTVDGGRNLTPEEKLGVITVLFLGGLDTTRGALGSIAYQVATRPELEDRLRDPAWARQDMDEFLRLASPVGCLARIATMDVELTGVRINKGEQLLIRFDSANRDESQFKNPSSLRFDRRGGNVAFGLGIHRCLGSHFARIQIAVAFEELFTRITHLRVADADAEIRWSPGIANGANALDLIFDVVQRQPRPREREDLT